MSFDNRKLETRDRIIRAAIELFELHGFQRVTIQDVANHARVTRGTVYNHIKDKRNLIKECVREILVGSAKRYAVILNSDEPFCTRLKKTTQDKSTMIRRFSGELEREVANQAPEVLEEIVEERRRIIHNAAIPFFAEGIELGSVAKDVGVQAILAFFDIIRTGVLESEMYREFARDNPDAFDVIQKMSIRAIRPATQDD